MAPRVSSPAKRRAFEDEALAHLDALHRYALRVTREPADAQDLVQEAVVKAYRSWHRYRPGTNCRAWLLAILRNAYRDHYRRWSRRRDSVSLEEVEERGASRPRGADPESAFFERVVAPEIRRAIADLPEEQRTPVLLSDVEGLTYAEIAEAMGIPLGTVRSRLFRGRRRLRRWLRAYALEAGYLRPGANGERWEAPSNGRAAAVNGSPAPP